MFVSMCVCTGRSQVSVVACKGSLLAVGGLDSWNCLSSVEMYSPVTDTWTMVAALSTVRRGAGVDVVGGESLLRVVLDRVRCTVCIKL